MRAPPVPSRTPNGTSQSEGNLTTTGQKHLSNQNNSMDFTTFSHYNNHKEDKNDKSHGGVLSPLEEDEEWARIGDIMASFGGGVARESVFMAELEQEFQQRLGLSLSPSQHHKPVPFSPRLQPNSDGQSDSASDAVDASGESPACLRRAGGSVPPKSPMDVGAWLRSLNLGQYEAVLLAHGYDDIEFIYGLLDSNDLDDMAIEDKTHKDRLLKGLATLPRGPLRPGDTVEEWLKGIRLSEYAKVFRRHGFGEMERVRKIWEVELSIVLEVSMLGHRKRMLTSLGDRPIEPELPASLAPQELSFELTKLNTDICALKQKLFQELPLSTSRERRPPETASNTICRGGGNQQQGKKRAPPLPPPPKAPRAQPTIDMGDDDSDSYGGNPPPKEPPPPPPRLTEDDLWLRDPCELAVGGGQPEGTRWKHPPNKLMSASVEYVAQYLGSTHVKELRGTVSTVQSIQKLRRSTAKGAKVPAILLSVSVKGVRFVDAVTQHVVCWHEIRNIQCACADGTERTHFAYITTDAATTGHYCHVFRADKEELATEIIMTLGEAFEIAYQLTLREQQQKKQQKKLHKNALTLASNQSDEQKLAQGHSRSLSDYGKNAIENTRARSSSIASYVPPKGSAAPNTSLENLLSDSGNFSDKDPDASGSGGVHLESSSPSVDSSSNGGSNYAKEDKEGS